MNVPSYKSWLAETTRQSPCLVIIHWMDLIAVVKGIFHSFHLTFVVTLPVVFWRKKSSPVLIQREALMAKSGEGERELQRKI